MKKHLENAPLYIEGWLMLLGFRLIAGIMVSNNSVMQALSRDLTASEQAAGILAILLILYALFVLFLFIKRHKAFPGAYVGLEALSIVSNLSAFLVSFNLETVSRNVFPLIYTIAPLVISALWIIYVLLSMRVKKTFVYNWNEKYDKRLVDKANGI